MSKSRHHAKVLVRQSRRLAADSFTKAITAIHASRESAGQEITKAITAILAAINLDHHPLKGVGVIQG